MSKWYIAYGIAAYALYKMLELIFGSGDFLAIIYIFVLSFCLIGYILFKGKASLTGAILLVFPLLSILALLGLRYFSVFELQDWGIWLSGLVLAVICAALFQRTHVT